MPFSGPPQAGRARPNGVSRAGPSERRQPGGLRTRNDAAFSFNAVTQLQQDFQPSLFSTIE
jgi:hypothetical protein